MKFAVEPLNAAHDRSRFSSGHDVLDRWLREHADTATGHGTRTYVLVPSDQARRVVGYFSVAPHLVRRSDLPRTIGRGASRDVPAILLAKLALEEAWQGHGLGSELLAWALRTIVDAARRAGGRVIVVDALDDAAAFYRAHGFVPIPDRRDRLVTKCSTAAQAVGLAWP